MPLARLGSVFFLIFLAVGFYFPIAQAITIKASGVTTFLQETTTASGTVSTSKKITINGGYAIPSACASSDGTTTCNSCVGNAVQSASGGSTPAPCNEHSVYDSLNLTISVDSDSADINGLPVNAALGSDFTGKQMSGFSANLVSGKSYTISTTWAQLFAALQVTVPCATTTGCGNSKIFYIGPVKDDKFIEAITVVVNYSLIGYTSKDVPLNGYAKALAQACPPTTVDPLVTDQSSTGLCYYEMFPGDKKAYITNLINGWKTSAIDPDTSLAYSNLIMYYVEKPASATSLATLSSIKNNSSKVSINILTDKEGDPLGSYKVTGLENSTTETIRTYCFLPAIQDVTGNIIYFLDIQKLMSTKQLSTKEMDKLCASPSEVVGVLSDKDCFIATVAFGTRNHPYLDILREFRNKFLHPYSWGKRFIKYYYANGPAWAKEIGDRNWAKHFVKISLLPVVGFAYLVLNPQWFLAIVFLGLFVFLGVRQVRRGLA